MPEKEISLAKLTIGGEELFSSLREQLAFFAQGDAYRNLYLKGFPGGGKTHWLELIKQTTAADYTNIRTAFLHPDIEAVLTEKNLCSAIAAAAGYEAGEKLADLVKLLSESGEKVLLLVESPESVFAGIELITLAGNSGFFVIAASDFAPRENYPGFLHLQLPEWGLSQIEEMLKLRGYDENITNAVTGFYRMIDFAPKNPQRAVELAEASGKSVESAGELFRKLIDFYREEFRRILNSLSGQQKVIFLAIAKSPSMLTPGEIAEKTGFPVTVVNVQLKRMRDGGVLQEISTGGKGVLHFPGHPLIRYWLSSSYLPGECALIRILEAQSDLNEADGRASGIFLRTVSKKVLPEPELTDEIRTVTSVEYFPEYPYETLTKTSASYLRGGDYRRVEAVMEVEAERSLNAGQNLRAGRALLFLGIARILLVNYESAKSAFKEAMARGEKHPLAETNLGALYAREGNMVSARGMFQQAVKAAEKLPQAYAGLGAVLREGGELKLAEEYFARSLQVDKNYAPALLGLANIHFAWGDYPAALQLAEDGLNVEGDNRSLLKLAAVTAYREGKYRLCSDYCVKLWEKAGQVESEVEKLFLCAKAEYSLLQVEAENYGLAEKAFCECFRPGISGKLLEEVLTLYLLALWKEGQERFWLKLSEILEDKLGEKVLSALKLYRMAAKRMVYGNAAGSGERLFPEESAVYEAILRIRQL